MAITFPMPWGSFAGIMPIASSPFRLRRFEEISWSGTGAPDVADLADPRWSCRVTLGVLHWWEAGEFETLIELHGSARPLWLHDSHRPGPLMDLDGALLGGAVPQVGSVSSSGVSISGLPAGYTLSRGDLVEINHGNPNRRGLYALAEGSVANASGVTSVMTLSPAPRPVTAAGQSVRLLAPRALMLILPESFDPGQRDGQIVRGMSFETVEAW